jgi:hypothetical protein
MPSIHVLQAMSSVREWPWNPQIQVPSFRRVDYPGVVQLEVSTPALLFPAISLLFLSYTNRFLHLSALIRQLHGDWQERHEEVLREQIHNLRKRLVLIRVMQLLGAVSLFVCVISMVAVVAGYPGTAVTSFAVALGLMGLSLATLCYEIWISGGALRILLSQMEGK